MALLLAAAPLALSACLPSPNSGSDAQKDFMATVPGYEHVSDAVASGNNALPFSGTGHAAVSVQDGTSLQQTKDLAHKIRAFAAGQSGMSWESLDLEFGTGDAVGIGVSDAVSDRRLDALGELRRSGRYVAIAMGAREDSVTRGNGEEGVWVELERSQLGGRCSLPSEYDRLAALGLPPGERGNVAVKGLIYRFGDDTDGTAPGQNARAAFAALCELRQPQSVEVWGDRVDVEVAPSAQAEVEAVLAGVQGIDTLRVRYLKP